MGELRIRIKFGDHEFEAEGPADSVEQRADAFNQIFAPPPPAHAVIEATPMSPEEPPAELKASTTDPADAAVQVHEKPSTSEGTMVSADEKAAEPEVITAPPPLRLTGAKPDYRPAPRRLKPAPTAGACATVRFLRLMRHGVDDRIHPKSVCIGCEFGRIVGIVHPFPGIAEVGVVRDQNHQAPGVVGNAADARLCIVRPFPCARASARTRVYFTKPYVGDLQDMIDIEKSMEDFMRNR